jgi:hypothetical protein
MFNLEQSIEEWRQQMLAAGIKSPVPLEELESHLREEIDRQIQSGIKEQQAFEVTVFQIGQGKELKTEFIKGRGWWNMLHDHMSTRARFMLVIWVAEGSLILTPYEVHHLPRTWLAGGLFIALLAILAIAAYLAGIFWSIFLSHSTKLVGNIVKVISLFSILIYLVLSVRELLRDWLSIVFYFNIFTLTLFEPRFPAESKKAAK